MVLWLAKRELYRFVRRESYRIVIELKSTMQDSPENTPSAEKTGLKRLPWKSWAGIILLLGVAYFANVEVQSYLGRKALNATGMQVYPLGQALSKAAVEKKLVLANMSAIWCPSCRKLDQSVFSDSAVHDAINRDYVFTRIEYESPEGKAFMEEYQVRGFPTLLVLDHTGKKLRQLPLTFNPRGFIALL